jgi:hypothetical protein
MFETNKTRRKQAETTERESEKNKKIGWETKNKLKQKVRTSIENSQSKMLFKFLKNNKKQKKK